MSPGCHQVGGMFGPVLSRMSDLDCHCTTRAANQGTEELVHAEALLKGTFRKVATAVANVFYLFLSLFISLTFYAQFMPNPFMTFFNRCDLFAISLRLVFASREKLLKYQTLFCFFVLLFLLLLYVFVVLVFFLVLCMNTAISSRGFATCNRTDGYAKSKIQRRSRKQSAGTDPDCG